MKKNICALVVPHTERLQKLIDNATSLTSFDASSSHSQKVKGTPSKKPLQPVSNSAISKMNVSHGKDNKELTKKDVSASTSSRKSKGTTVSAITCISENNISQGKDKNDVPKQEIKKKNRRKGRKPKNKKEPVKLISVNTLPEAFAQIQIVKPINSSTPKIVEKTLGPSFVSATDFQMTYRIKIGRRSTCRLFRKRSTRYRYINLKSFVGPATTYVFKSNIPGLQTGSGVSLTRSIKNKIQRRKYPVAQIQKLDRIESGKREGSMDKEIYEWTERAKNSAVADAGHSEISDSSNALLESETSCLDTTVSQLELHENRSPKKQKKRYRPKKIEKHIQHKLQKQIEKEAEEHFPQIYTEKEVEEGLEKGDLIKGFLRVNPKNAKDSYVSNEDTSLSDYHITSVADRNRGLDGDEVVIKLKPQEEWKEGKPTAVVVHILKKVNSRTMIGILVPYEESQESTESKFAIFRPRDKRFPLTMIPKLSCPNGFITDPKRYQKTLYLAKMLEWEKPAMASGVILESIGMSGDLRVETQSILKEFELDVTPFPPEMIELLPKSMVIPESELQYREDIRKECVFTIDPFTARDLDDAVSVKKLPNGNYEVGVHISDASYYLKEGTPLDHMVCSKATTIYLVDNVYHMLPVELCLHCSLLPGEDKLAFSVFWEMNEDGEIFDTRFSRTVLNSCVQLAYEHAQIMIDNPTKEYTSEEMPHIYNGFTVQDLSQTVNILQKIAVNLRNARVENGSLRIDQIKLLFSLDPKTGEPNDFKVYENKEAHRLIEEFMLLANISVAKKINDSFSDLAFLRCHEHPKYAMLLEAQQVLESCGIHIDISSSGGIHSSVRKYITDDFPGQIRSVVLNHIFAKPMTRARYFCAASMSSPLDYGHYALSVPIYTHFTSPIRRYADIMVHRLLAASLGYSKRPAWSTQSVQEIAANCNKQKYNAKRAGEASSDFYLAYYIEKHQPYIEECVVVDVKERSFDVIVLSTGSTVRIYQKRCQDKPAWVTEPILTEKPKAVQTRDREFTKKFLRLILTYPKNMKYPQEQRQIVELFSLVRVKLTRRENEYKLDGYLMRPVPTKVSQRKSR